MLPAVDVEPLAEVALVVIQPDAHQRDAEIRGALQMIAGEDAEAAGVDRQRLVQAELRGEVGHRPRAEHAGVLAAPGVLRLQVLLQPPVGVVDASVQGELRRPRFELRDRHLLQQQDGIVVALAPPQRVELAEQADRLFVPAPPQVLRQRQEALVHRGDEVADRARLAHDRRQLRARRRQHAEVVVAERPRLRRLHDQDALQHAAIDHRHADERAIRVLSRLVEVLEARVLRRVAHEHRPQLLGDQPCQPLGDPHLHPADALRPQADRGRQHQRRAVGLEQVDGADVGDEALLNEVDDVGQGFRRIAAAGDELTDFFERPEERWCDVHKGPDPGGKITA